MEKDILHVKKSLKAEGRDYTYYSLAELQSQGYDIDKLPF